MSEIPSGIYRWVRKWEYAGTEDMWHLATSTGNAVCGAYVGYDTANVALSEGPPTNPCRDCQSYMANMLSLRMKDDLE